MDPKIIEQIIKDHNIEISGTHTIGADGVVSVTGDVNYYSKDPKSLEPGAVITGKIPVQFGTVTGSFTVMGQGVSSLEGCPRVVQGDFTVNLTLAPNLIGSPVEIGGACWVAMNKNLFSLDGLPRKIGHGNTTKSHVLKVPYAETMGLLRMIVSDIKVNSAGIAMGNKAPPEVVSIIARYAGKPTPAARQGAALAAAAELIKAGYRDHARL